MSSFFFGISSASSSSSAASWSLLFIFLAGSEVFLSSFFFGISSSSFAAFFTDLFAPVSFGFSPSSSSSSSSSSVGEIGSSRFAFISSSRSTFHQDSSVIWSGSVSASSGFTGPFSGSLSSACSLSCPFLTLLLSSSGPSPLASSSSSDSSSSSSSFAFCSLTVDKRSWQTAGKWK